MLDGATLLRNDGMITNTSCGQLWNIKHIGRYWQNTVSQSERKIFNKHKSIRFLRWLIEPLKGDWFNRQLERDITNQLMEIELSKKKKSPAFQ